MKYRPLKSQRIQPKSLWLYGSAIVALHGLAVIFMLWGNANAVLWGSALLAYTFGLRHAFDIDHITAIDNTVRKISGFHSHSVLTPAHVHRREKDRGLGVGFYFSLGHSSVVFLISCGLAFATSWAVGSLPFWKEFGALWGTSISGSFLVLIGAVNLALWIQIVRQFRRIRQGEGVSFDASASPGFLTRLFSKLFKFVQKSWHLFPLGFLFGLGFDTASEVALLSLSTQGALQTQSWQVLLALPLFFAAGMCLMDTADGVFMVKAYRWADRSPLRKVFYNLCITGFSILVAFFVGATELFQTYFKLTSSTSTNESWVSTVDFSSLGYVLTGALAAFWLGSYLVWKKINRSAGEKV